MSTKNSGLTTSEFATAIRHYLPIKCYVLFTPQDSMVVSDNGDDIIRTIQALELQKQAATEQAIDLLPASRKIDHIAPNGEPV